MSSMDEFSHTASITPCISGNAKNIIDQCNQDHSIEILEGGFQLFES